MSVDCAYERSAGPSLEIQLLGGVQVVSDGDTRTARSPRLRTLLALLALNPGEPVDPDVLAGELWECSAPQDPRAALHILVSRLRAWLAPEGPRPGPIRRDRGGYLLDVDPDRIDVVRFHREASSALAPEGTMEAAEASLALWNGDPFTGCASPRLDLERALARERFMRVVERRAELLLAGRRPAEAVDGLAGLLESHRDRESLTTVLMTALYRCGRQHEALTAYEMTRRYLREEYGLEPSADLIALHRRMLAQDPTLATECRVPGPRPPSGSQRRGGTGRPRSTIRGRDREIGSVLDLLRGDGGIVVVEGETGIGKSALARSVSEEAVRTGARTGWGSWSGDDEPLVGWSQALSSAEGHPPTPPTTESILERLEALPDDRPTLMVLDDLHRAEPASLGLLRRLAPELPSRVVVLALARTFDVEVSARWRGLLADLVREPAVTRLRLEELERPAVAALVEDRIPQHRRWRDLEELVWQRSGGHPLHVVALLQMLQEADPEEGVGALADMVPERLRPLLEHQASQLPASCRELLDGLSILRPISLSSLSAAAGRDELATAQDLRPAVDAGVVVPEEDSFVFRHELTACAIRHAVPPATRERWRRADPRRLSLSPRSGD